MRAKPPAPEQPPRCKGCGASWACFGLVPPIVDVPERWCGACIQFQPATQAALADMARAAIKEDLSR